MGDVSIVSRLIQSLLAVAFGAACLGTLGDIVFAKKDQAAHAMKHEGMSYGKWNRRLLGEPYVPPSCSPAVSNSDCSSTHRRHQ